MRPVKRVVEQPGAVKAFEETVLYAKISGHVRTIADDPLKADRPPHDRTVDIGSRVRKDQLLVELSVPELEEEYKQKEATVRQGDAEVVQAKKVCCLPRKSRSIVDQFEHHSSFLLVVFNHDRSPVMLILLMNRSTISPSRQCPFSSSSIIIAFSFWKALW